MVQTVLRLLLFFVCSGIFAQQTVILPDCIWSFSTAVPAASSSFNNTATRCTSWAVVQEVYNGAVVSATFQQAPSDAAGTGAGAFVTFIGTGTNPVTGTNPLILTPATATFTGFAPWVRLNVTALTGSYRATVFGWRAPNSISSGSGGGGGGSTAVTNLSVCEDKTITKQRAQVTFTAATGPLQIIAASGTTQITLCSLSILGDTAATLKLLYGTGVNCGTGTTQITGGGYVNALGLALDSTTQLPALPASQAFCISSSVATTLGGMAVYVQQ